MKLLKTFIATSIVALSLASCGEKTGFSLSEAGAIADSIADADADGKVVVNAADLQASFTIDDTDINLTAIGQELFDLFAAQQLKKLSATDINNVCDALRDSKGVFITVLNSPNGESVSFSLTPQQIINLQRAKNSELNLGAARGQVIAVAEGMVPAPESHVGAARVETSVTKSFLEYNIVWPKVSSYSKLTQGNLTGGYLKPLRQQYKAMGRLAEPIIAMLEAMGIDGVRIVYSAEDSDKVLKQAFPWREIRLPVED